MRIIWNDTEQYFQAELTPGDNWRDDMEAVKAAGFNTTGPPQWLWYTPKSSVLNKLRGINKPKSGLTITEIAIQKFKFLDEQDQKKKEIKKQFEQAKKAAKKLSLDPSISGLIELIIPEKGYLDASDFPPYVPISVSFLIPQPPKEHCLICDEPIYFYEHLVCLWCEKEAENNP